MIAIWYASTVHTVFGNGGYTYVHFSQLGDVMDHSADEMMHVVLDKHLVHQQQASEIKYVIYQLDLLVS